MIFGDAAAKGFGGVYASVEFSSTSMNAMSENELQQHNQESELLIIQLHKKQSSIVASLYWQQLAIAAPALTRQTNLNQSNCRPHLITIDRQEYMQALSYLKAVCQLLYYTRRLCGYSQLLQLYQVYQFIYHTSLWIHIPERHRHGEQVCDKITQCRALLRVKTIWRIEQDWSGLPNGAGGCRDPCPVPCLEASFGQRISLHTSSVHRPITRLHILHSPGRGGLLLWRCA